MFGPEAGGGNTIDPRLVFPINTEVTFCSGPNKSRILRRYETNPVGEKKHDRTKIWKRVPVFNDWERGEMKNCGFQFVLLVPLELMDQKTEENGLA